MSGKDNKIVRTKQNIVKIALCVLVSIIASVAKDITGSWVLWVLICFYGGWLIGKHLDKLTRWLWWD